MFVVDSFSVDQHSDNRQIRIDMVTAEETLGCIAHAETILNIVLLIEATIKC
jgi:hypothetical protein